VERNKSAANYLTIAFLCSIGIWQIYHGCMISGILFRYPHLALVHVPFLYVSAPLLYFYFQILVRDDFKFRASSLYHFIPVLLILLLIWPFYMKSAGEKLELLQSFVGLRGTSRVFPAYPYIVMSIVMTICGYALAVAVNSFRMYRKKLLTEKNITYYSIIIIAFNFIMIIIYILGFLTVKLLLPPGSYYLTIIKTISIIMTVEIYIILLIKWRSPITSRGSGWKRSGYVTQRHASRGSMWTMCWPGSKASWRRRRSSATRTSRSRAWPKSSTSPPTSFRRS
jgi:hypothetical protein